MPLPRTLTRAGAMLAATALAASLAACSSDGGGEDADSGASDNASFPVTVDTKFGDVSIDEEPERVVALGWGDAETALALDVQPVGASDWLAIGGDGVGPWIGDGEGYDESPEIIDTLEPEYEKIAALEPDLILDVKSSGDRERHDRLSDIATTVGVQEGSDNYGTGFDEQVTTIATALGQEERGAELVSEYEDKLAEIREAHPDWQDKTVTAVEATQEGWGATVGARGLTDFGFTENPTTAELEAGDIGFSAPLSDETLTKAEADLVVGFAIGRSVDEVEDDSAWKRLGATKDGRSFVMPDEISLAYSVASPQSNAYILDQLVPVLEEHTGE